MSSVNFSASEALRDAFDAMDKKGFGYLDREEWVKGLSDLEVELPQCDMKKIFPLLSKNSDGDDYIYREDFVQFRCKKFRTTRFSKIQDKILNKVYKYFTTHIIRSPTPMARQTSIIFQSEIYNWNEYDVINWLQDIGLYQYSDQFYEHEIDGPTLIVDVDEDFLKNEIKMKIIHIKKILREINKLQDEFGLTENEENGFSETESKYNDEYDDATISIMKRNRNALNVKINNNELLVLNRNCRFGHIKLFVCGEFGNIYNYQILNLQNETINDDQLLMDLFDERVNRYICVLKRQDDIKVKKIFSEFEKNGINSSDTQLAYKKAQFSCNISAIFFQYIGILQQKIEPNKQISQNPQNPQIWRSKMEALEKENLELKEKNLALQKENDKLNGLNLKHLSIKEKRQLLEQSKQSYHKIEQDIFDQYQNQTLCQFCCDQERKIVFLPCSHLVACLDCANKLPRERCPICNTHITKRISVFDG